MTKSEQIKAIAESAGITQVDAKKAYDAMAMLIINTLKSGGKIAIDGVGSFSVKDKPARKGRNPQTGAEIDIPARKAVAFSATKALKDAI